MPKAKKLPKYVRQRKWGSYQYKRNVPKHLIEQVGKATVYRSLGDTYKLMVTNLPIVHQAVETYFQRLEGETSVERTLALVERNYGRAAAEQLERGEVDSNLEAGLWALGHHLEAEEGLDEKDPEVFGHLLSASLPPKVFSLETAYELYAAYKDADSNRNLQKYLNRSKADLVNTLGKVAFSETPMTKLTRTQALAYRDALLDRVRPASVERYVTTVKAVINHSIDELGLQMNNPFNRLKVKGAAASAGDRQSLSETDVIAVRGAISSEDLKALYEALAATGARLSEVCGMEVGDMNPLERAIHIRPNSIRKLKTSSSERIIPLPDVAYDLLCKLTHGREGDEPLFVRYGRPNGNTAASAALMKSVRKVITEKKKGVHSLRHRKADQLRQIEAPDELRKVILGHSNREVAARYGDGYSLEVLRKWLSKTW